MSTWSQRLLELLWIGSLDAGPVLWTLDRHSTVSQKLCIRLNSLPKVSLAVLCTHGIMQALSLSQCHIIYLFMYIYLCIFRYMYSYHLSQLSFHGDSLVPERHRGLGASHVEAATTSTIIDLGLSRNSKTL